MTEYEDPRRQPLVNLVIFQAYKHPKWAHIRFPKHERCPQCGTEFALIVQEDEWKRLLLCFNCGYRYGHKELAA